MPPLETDEDLDDFLILITEEDWKHILDHVQSINENTIADCLIDCFPDEFVFWSKTNLVSYLSERIDLFFPQVNHERQTA